MYFSRRECHQKILCLCQCLRFYPVLPLTESAKKDRWKVQITFSLFDSKHDCQQSQWCIYRYLLTRLFRLYSTKTENLLKRFIFRCGSHCRRTCSPSTSIFQHGNSVQITLHKHWRFRKGLYQVAMNSNVLHFRDMQGTRVM